MKFVYHISGSRQDRRLVAVPESPSKLTESKRIQMLLTSKLTQRLPLLGFAVRTSSSASRFVILAFLTLTLQNNMTLNVCLWKHSLTQEALPCRKSASEMDEHFYLQADPKYPEVIVDRKIFSKSLYFRHVKHFRSFVSQHAY